MRTLDTCGFHYLAPSVLSSFNKASKSLRPPISFWSTKIIGNVGQPVHIFRSKNQIEIPLLSLVVSHLIKFL